MPDFSLCAGCPRPPAFAERFIAKLVESDSGCWEWQGSLNPKGYGQLNDRGVIRKVHRVAYEMFIGPIPDGLGVLHSCDNRKCANPAHLRAGTNADNVADRVARKRCARGERNRHKYPAALVRKVLEHTGSTREIAQALGMSKSQVWSIKAGKSWASLPKRITRSRSNAF